MITQVGTVSANSDESVGEIIVMGLLDPAKVIRSALQNAVSVANLMITTGVMVADAPSDGSAPSMPDMGDMMSVWS